MVSKSKIDVLRRGLSVLSVIFVSPRVKDRVAFVKSAPSLNV